MCLIDGYVAVCFCLCRALAEAVKAAATTFKPKPTLKVPSLDDLPDVPKNLHKVRVRGFHCLGRFHRKHAAQGLIVERVQH